MVLSFHFDCILHLGFLGSAFVVSFGDTFAGRLMEVGFVDLPGE